MFDFVLTKECTFGIIQTQEQMFANKLSVCDIGVMIMKAQKSIYYMTDRELRSYKRSLRRQREIRRKCFTFLMTFCLIVICAISYHSINTSAHTTDEETNFKYYTSITVAYGETLWDIADNYIDYKEYDDKNDYIEEVRSINHLDEESAIRAGQHLIVPYYSTEFVK